MWAEGNWGGARQVSTRVLVVGGAGSVQWSVGNSRVVSWQKAFTCTSVLVVGCKRIRVRLRCSPLGLPAQRFDVDVLHCVDSARRLSNGRGERLLGVLVGVGGEEGRRG